MSVERLKLREDGSLTIFESLVLMALLAIIRLLVWKETMSTIRYQQRTCELLESALGGDAE